jgi:tetratricopeptide (TPR) repeat protein
MGRIWLAACFVRLVLGAAPDFEQARRLYTDTDFDGSLKVLLQIPDKDGAIYELIGRNYYMTGDFKRATEFLEKAVAAEPGSSAHVMWLGRAYGRRAETSSMLTAPGYASKARQNFEKAMALDPHSLEALNDLFEYYLEAPGFLGGGYDKAARLAGNIAAIDPVEGHWAQAKMAEKRKEYGSAEENFRRAADLAPQQVGRLLDLARFLAKQGRYQESDQSFLRAEKIAPGSPKVMFVKADTYIRNKRNLDTARDLLKRYLSAHLTPEDPPRSEAERLLKQVSGS